MVFMFIFSFFVDKKEKMNQKRKKSNDCHRKEFFAKSYFLCKFLSFCEVQILHRF